jgi:phytoene desaturase
MKKCAVVGSGIAGLASAIRAAAKGYQVDVFEANPWLGGKLREINDKGYRFDIGPSVFTMPHLVDELFTLCGKNPQDYFPYTQLDTSFRYFFEDGTHINAYADVNAFANEIAQKTDDSADTVFRFLKDVKKKYDITNEVFMENSIHLLRNHLTVKTFSGLVNFWKIDAFKTMDALNRKFFKDPRNVQVFNNFASYVGSNPFIAPGTLNVIPHLEINMGLYLPKRGMYGIVEALVKLAEEMGVAFHVNTPVEEILVENGQVKGLRTKDGANQPFDAVVSNMDVYYTYHKLLPNQVKPKRTLSQPKSTSVIVFYWGLNKTHEALGVHNMLFAKDEKEEYEAIFKRNDVSMDPSLYVNITSKEIKSDAPVGGENWFVLLSCPNNQGQNWEEIIARTRQNVIAKINRMLNTDIEAYIETEGLLSPEMIQSTYSSAYGAVYGNSSDSRFAAFLRHPNFSRKIKNLYFVGGSVHPGAGLPTCLNSAKIVGKML